MKRISLDQSWPASWKDSYFYDQLEFYKSTPNGYSLAYRNRYKHTLALVECVAKKGAKVLDIAAAQGNFTLSLAEMGYEVTWNDLRDELVGYVQLKYEHGTIHYAPGNAFDLGFDEQFDVVLITEIIEHVAHPDDFLTKVSRLVKPGGHIVMTTPNGGYFLNDLPKFSECLDPSQYEAMQFKPNSDGHIFLLHTEEIYELARKSGLRVDTVQLFTNFLTNGHLKTAALLKVLPKSLTALIEKVSRSLPIPVRRKLHAGMAVLFTRVA